jgi:dTDP-L-rhamnose 4-epimerase
MTLTCIVTGGAGFIGCAISSKLASHFERVIAVDNLHQQIHPRQIRPQALDSRVQLVVGDVTSEGIWDNLLNDVMPHTIIHLAAETGTGQSLTEGSRHAAVNVLGTTRMLDALARHQKIPQRIVLSSSRAVYGEGAWQDASTGVISYPGQRSHAQMQRQEWDFPGLACLPFEALKIKASPTSIYGATKLAQEHILSAWALSFGVEAPILRLQNVYGPGQSLTNPYTGIVPFFAGLAREGKSIPVYEDGEIVRDFVFIDDVADALAHVAIEGSASSIPYDIGTGQGVTIYQLAYMIADLYQAPLPHINGAFRNGDVRHAVCDVARTRSELGWSPHWNVERGVKILCEWIDSLQETRRTNQ